MATALSGLMKGPVLANAIANFMMSFLVIDL
jgi:hypothetical protein